MKKIYVVVGIEHGVGLVYPESFDFHGFRESSDEAEMLAFDLNMKTVEEEGLECSEGEDPSDVLDGCDGCVVYTVISIPRG